MIIIMARASVSSDFVARYKCCIVVVVVVVIIIIIIIIIISDTV